MALFFLVLSGLLPLGIILYKRNMVRKLVRTGTPVKARVYDIRTTRRQPQDIVYYFFQTGKDSQQYTGTLNAAVGTFKKGQTVDVYYLPANPKKHVVKGAWKSNVLVGFGIALALFFLFAAYKIHQMIAQGM